MDAHKNMVWFTKKILPHNGNKSLELAKEFLSAIINCGVFHKVKKLDLKWDKKDNGSQ